MRKIFLLGLLGLSACGPMPVHRAEAQCYESARRAEGPTGEIGMGVASGRGAVGTLELNLSSDWIAGKDPSAVYETCVMAKSGEAPRIPYHRLQK